jgi:hypothetical protein
MLYKSKGLPIVGHHYEIALKYTSIKYCGHFKLNLKDEYVSFKQKKIKFVEQKLVVIRIQDHRVQGFWISQKTQITLP